ncbi:MAG TPA: TonB family protein [Longimicrobiales bacterium]|nr:TonB family protein [Longimicrobiales bacterium]
MTAAAIRPPQHELFNTLFASRPARPDKSSFAATTMSVAFHAALVAGLIWASVQLKREVAAPIVEKIPSVFIPVAPMDEPSRSTSSSSPAPSTSSIAVPTPLPVPSPVTSDIPASSSQPVFADPGTAQSSPSGTGTDPNATTHGTGDSNDGFIAVSVMPALVNANDVRRALERNYPALLRDAGISGKAILWLFIDETGKVVRAEVKESSGHAAFDDAAMRVAPIMKFSPARNRDSAVKVMVAVPILFTTK